MHAGLRAGMRAQDTWTRSRRWIPRIRSFMSIAMPLTTLIVSCFTDGTRVRHSGSSPGRRRRGAAGMMGGGVLEEGRQKDLEGSH